MGGKFEMGGGGRSGKRDIQEKGVGRWSDLRYYQKPSFVWGWGRTGCHCNTVWCHSIWCLSPEGRASGKGIAVRVQPSWKESYAYTTSHGGALPSLQCEDTGRRKSSMAQKRALSSDWPCQTSNLLKREKWILLIWHLTYDCGGWLLELTEKLQVSNIAY